MGQGLVGVPKTCLATVADSFSAAAAASWTNSGKVEATTLATRIQRLQAHKGIVERSL
jgi:hypothetical protein